MEVQLPAGRNNTISGKILPPIILVYLRCLIFLENRIIGILCDK